MIAMVTLTLEDKTDEDVEVTIRDGLTGVKLLTAIDKAVQKKFKDRPDWTRWSLRDVK